MNLYKTVCEYKPTAHFGWTFKPKQNRQTMSFQSMLPSKWANIFFIHGNEWRQRRWLMVSRAVVVAMAMAMAVVVTVMIVAPCRRRRAPCQSHEDDGSAPAARPLHSTFHCCFQLSVDCCVCFPNAILTKPSTSNNTHLQMDQFLLFSLGATIPQAE
jgi:hypothetical protein